MLEGVFSDTGGVLLPQENYLYSNLENSHCEGYHQQIEYSSLFLWNLTGEIIHSGINFLGIE